MKTLILSPHIDDELIGCYEVLDGFSKFKEQGDSLDVIWLFEATRNRIAEGYALASHFSFQPMICNIDQAKVYVEANGYDNIYVPCRQDGHVAHKVVNTHFRKYATYFYSVDMVRRNPLSLKDAQYKQALLDRFYPSQRQLWDSNAAYYLFSDISPVDYVVYKTLSYPNCSCIVSENYEYDVDTYMRTKVNSQPGSIIFNDLVAMCPTGEVTYTHSTGQIYKI